MRCTIELPDALLTEARELTGLRTKRAVVEAALSEYVRRRRLERLLSRLGNAQFDLTQEDLEQMRADD